MQQLAVSLKNVRKKYRLFKSPRERLLEALHPFRKPYHSPFWALNGVTLDVPQGQVLGIVGRNGSGKSTLLQVIAGILRPTEGEVNVHGRVAALLELGAGFNPQFTGRDNVLLHAAITGVARDDAASRLDKVAAFADIGPFFDQPVLTYSSGMFVRLAFAAAIHVDPDILIVDEALAVGDAQFQQKCFRRLRELRESGTTILFVTHSIDTLVQLCDRAVLLEEGRVALDGDPRSVCDEYIKLLFGPKKDSVSNGEAAPAPEVFPPVPDAEDVAHAWGMAKDDTADAILLHPLYNKGEIRYGTREAEIIGCRIVTDGAADLASITGHSPIDIYLRVAFHCAVPKPIVGFALKTKEGTTIYGSNTFIEQAPLPGATAHSLHVYRIHFSARLNVGDYFIDLGIAHDDGTNGGAAIDVRRSVMNFSVVATHPIPRQGLIDLSPRFELLS